MKAKLVWKKQINPLLAVMKFEVKEKKDFKPGQFFHIKLGAEKIRPYSVVSLPQEKDYEFYVKGYDNGRVAKHIFSLEEGSEVEILGPHGRFILQDDFDEIYFICAGSGIAPVMGMARELAGKEKKITFLHGASYTDELVYNEELKQMENSNFKYIPTISRPQENSDWDGETGRVIDHLDVLDNNEAQVYICGPPPMVNHVLEELKKKGFSRDNIFKEQYY